MKKDLSQIEEKIILLLNGVSVLDARYLLDRVKIEIERKGIVFTEKETVNEQSLFTKEWERIARYEGVILEPSPEQNEKQPLC